LIDYSVIDKIDIYNINAITVSSFWQSYVIDAKNLETTYTYDNVGNLKTIDTGTRKIIYTYDLLNRRTDVQDAENIITHTEYNPFGEIKSVTENYNLTDLQTRTTQSKYDNLLTETWGSTLKQTYTYDNTSHLLTSYDATSNNTNTYTYNAIYQLTDTTTANTKFHYDYDIYGDLIQRQDWINNSKIATLDYTYNHNHQLKHISQTGTGVVATEIDFSYDKLSQLQQIDRTSANDSTRVITQDRYTNVGLLEDLNNYAKTNTNDTTNISHYHYTYDPGNRLKFTTGTDGNKAVDYSKDNQFNTVTTSTGSNEAYQFDTLGNRSTWSTDPLDSRRLLNDGTYKYLYDDEGNLTDKTELATGKITTYQWDYRNRLVSVTSDSHTIEYLYDAQDKRVGKQLDGMIQERYIYDGEDIALVVDAAGTLVERYLYGANTDNVLSIEQ
jgi:YD repeat-containing protein